MSTNQRSTRMRWIDSILRAIIAGLAGIGAACITNHVSRRPNSAYFISIVTTGIVVAVLNRDSRAEPSEPTPVQSERSPTPPPPAPSAVTPRALVAGVEAARFPELDNPPMNNELTRRESSVTGVDEGTRQQSRLTDAQ